MTDTPPFTWTGDDCPIWRGKPSQCRIDRILYLTSADRSGRLYMRDGGGMRRLDGAAANIVRMYALLNERLNTWEAAALR